MSTTNEHNLTANGAAFLLGGYCTEPDTNRLQELVLRCDLGLSAQVLNSLQSQIDAIVADIVSHERDPWRESRGRRNALAQKPPEFEVSTIHSNQLCVICDTAFKGTSSLANCYRVGRKLTVLMTRHQWVVVATIRVSATQSRLTSAEADLDEAKHRVDENSGDEAGNPSGEVDVETHTRTVEKASPQLENAQQHYADHLQHFELARQDAQTAIEALPADAGGVATRLRRFVELLNADSELAAATEDAFSVKLSATPEVLEMVARDFPGHVPRKQQDERDKFIYEKYCDGLTNEDIEK
jgi:hypothetical protein